MRRNERPKKKEEFLEAYEKTLGIITPAAAAVGVGRQTVYRWAKEDTEFADAMKAIEDKQKDFVESKLLTLIKEGNVAAIIFYAKTRMRDRGYAEHIKLGTKAEPLKIEFVQEDSLLEDALRENTDEDIKKTD